MTHCLTVSLCLISPQTVSSHSRPYKGREVRQSRRETVRPTVLVGAR
jgi:hypothetical protein